MPNYRRVFTPGGTFFFTATLADRSSSLLIGNIDVFRKAYAETCRKQPFHTVAICVLPDHVHTVWQLPVGDSDYPGRWQSIKARFSRAHSTQSGQSTSLRRKRERGIWQRRYWEHQILDERDLEHHVDYIHFNPVKHGLVDRVCDWPYSSFHRFVAQGALPRNWAGEHAAKVRGHFGE